MATTFITHVQAGAHAARPGAGAVPQGTLYACSDHGLIYQSDGTSTWATYYGTSAVSSFGSNVNAVGHANAGGASSSNTRADHVHLGVRTLSHTSNTFAGPVILTASGTLGITSPTPGTFDLTATAGAAAGGGGVTVQDEGTPLATTGTTLNFVGAGVAATGSGATKTITIGGGGGGLSQSYLGYNTIGGTWTTMTAFRILCKQVTFSGTTNLLSIDAYLRPSTDNLDSVAGMLMEDNAGAPGVLVGGADVGATSRYYLSNSGSMPGAGRWVRIPVTGTFPAGTYWIAVESFGARFDIANDAAGADQYFNPGAFYVTGAYPSAWAITTGTVHYSIRASILS